MTAHQVSTIITLQEKNGAPRHEDEKLMALIKQAVKAVNDERDRTMVEENNALLKRVASGFERLSETLEAYVSGERDVAVACMTDAPTDDLPSISRVKADSSLIYTLSASDIAEQTGLSVGDVSYLLSQAAGLDWVHRKIELWNATLFAKTKRRLWHPTTPKLLLAVIEDSGHLEREDISTGCARVLERAAAAHVNFLQRSLR
jgi:hypothetical protein